MMWECEYSREPVDYRLLWLRLLRKIWIIPLAMLAGAVLAGACHYYVRTAARGGRTYQTESMFYVDFAEDAQGVDYDYYNYYTWGELIHTDFFMDQVYGKMGGTLSEEAIISCITATVESDVRYLYVRCNTHSPELSMELASIMEEIVPQFADTRKEIRAIETVKAGDTARDSSKLRLGNAFLLGGGLGLGISLFWLLIALTTDPRIFLPATVERRYHITCLGAPFMPEFPVNWKYVLQDAADVAVVFVDGDHPNGNGRNEVCGSGAGQSGELGAQGDEKRNILRCGNPVEHPEELDRIRKCQKVLLVLKACCKNDKIFERLLEQLGRQGIRPDAVILADADERLIAKYYRSRK